MALLFAGVAVILSLTTWFSATSVMPALIQHFALTSSQSAWLTNGVQLGFVVGALTFSFLSLADVWRVTHVMAVAAVLAAVGNGALLLDIGATGAIVSRFVTGVALAGIYPPALKFVATWFVAGRGLAMGAMVGALTLGSALPHLFQAVGVQFGWRAVIGFGSLSCLCAGAVFLMLRTGPHLAARNRVDVRQVFAVVRNRPLMLANCGYFGHMWELYAMWGWILAYASQSPALSGPDALSGSGLAFLVIAAGAPSCVIAGMLADRIGRCWTTAGAMAVSGSCALLIGLTFSGPAWLFITVALVWGFTVVADSAQFSAAVSELSPPEWVGSALAFQMGVGFALTIAAIWLVRFVADAAGSWQWVFLVVAPGPALGIVAMLRLRRDDAAVALAQGKR